MSIQDSIEGLKRIETEIAAIEEILRSGKELTQIAIVEAILGERRAQLNNRLNVLRSAVNEISEAVAKVGTPILLRPAPNTPPNSSGNAQPNLQGQAQPNIPGQVTAQQPLPYSGTSGASSPNIPPAGQLPPNLGGPLKQ